MGRLPWGGGGGGTPLYKPYRYVPPQRVWFLRLFGLKTGIDFAPFGLESGVVFEGTRGVYERILRRRNKTESQNSKQNHKTQNRITKFKTESQNSKQNHKIQNRITKSKIETQNSKQNHKTQNRNTKLESEKGTQRTKHRRTLLPHHSSISIKPEKERVIVREKKQILVMRRSLLTFFVPPTFNFPFSYYFCSVVAFIVPTLI